MFTIPREVSRLIRVPSWTRFSSTSAASSVRIPSGLASHHSSINRTIPMSYQKLKHVLPKIQDKEEFQIAKQYIDLLSTFDTGITQDKDTCSKLRDILLTTKHRSVEFKELLRISRLRLLKILSTNHFFAEAFYLLGKDRDNHVRYQETVAPSVVSGILINLWNFEELSRYLKLVASRQDLSQEKRRKFTRSMVKNFMHIDRIGLGLKFWHDYAFSAYGRLNFDSVVKNPDCLLSLHLILNQYDASSVMQYLIKFKELNNLSNYHFSMLLSSCIYSLSGRSKNHDTIFAIWNHKKTHGLDLVPADLTAVMKVSLWEKNHDRVLKLYEENPLLHEDAQFDCLLKVHGAQHQWQNMQKQFEELFGRGELPNIRHYAIVMTALAGKGEKRAVEMLWDQLNSRKMIPTIHVLHAMMLSSIKTGDFRTAIAWFQKVESFGLPYTAQSYNYLFQALRGLKQLKVQLKFFKRLIFEEKFEVDHQLFNEILLSCLEANDVKTAEFVYTTAHEYGYDLGDVLEAIMLNIYTNTHNYQKVEQHIKSMVQENKPVSGKLYNQLILSFMKRNEYNAVLDLVKKMRAANVEVDSHTYSFLLSALVKSKQPTQALQLFEGLASQFTTKQYNAFLKTLLNSPYYMRIPKIYDTLIENNMTPDLESYKYLIKGLCKQYTMRRADPEISVELAVKVVNTILVDKSKNALSETVINLPFDLVYKLLLVALNYDFNLCRGLFVDFYNSCGDKASLENDIKFNYVSLKIHEKERDFAKFSEAFKRHVELLSSKFAINPTTERVSKKTTPKYITYGLNEFWKTQMSIQAQSEIPQVMNQMKALQAKGFRFTNKSYNETVMALFSSKESYEEALRFIEDKMIDGYIYLRRRRKHFRLLHRTEQDSTLSTAFEKARPKLYLEGLSYIKMVQILKKYLKRDPNRAETLEALTAKYPKTLRFYKFRARVANMWYASFLKHGYKKKVKFSTEHEGNMYRHQERLTRKVLMARKAVAARERRGLQTRRMRRSLNFGKRSMSRRDHDIVQMRDRDTVMPDLGIPAPFVSRITSVLGKLQD